MEMHDAMNHLEVQLREHPGVPAVHLEIRQAEPNYVIGYLDLESGDTVAFGFDATLTDELRWQIERAVDRVIQEVKRPITRLH